MESSSVVSQKLVVSGEDEESEGEIDIEFEKPVVVVPVTDPTLMSAAKLAGREQIPVSTGEAPESDIEVDFDSTISSNSVEDSLTASAAGRLLGSSWTHYLPSGIMIPKSSSRLDPSILRKHRERNKALRTNIFEKFLTPVINNNIKKIDKLSQGLSNSQMQVQDALFQSRVSTANLLKLQAEIESFIEADYLRDLKTIDEIQGIRVPALKL